MDLSVLSSYLNVVIVGICLCIGYIIKNIYTSEKINKYIPLIVGSLGLMLAIMYNRDNITLEVILMGLFSGLASTGLYETFKNLIGGGK